MKPTLFYYLPIIKYYWFQVSTYLQGTFEDLKEGFKWMECQTVEKKKDKLPKRKFEKLKKTNNIFK